MLSLEMEEKADTPLAKKTEKDAFASQMKSSYIRIYSYGTGGHIIYIYTSHINLNFSI
jgi:hypothetical protein